MIFPAVLFVGIYHDSTFSDYILNRQELGFLQDAKKKKKLEASQRAAGILKPPGASAGGGPTVSGPRPFRVF